MSSRSTALLQSCAKPLLSFAVALCALLECSGPAQAQVTYNGTTSSLAALPSGDSISPLAVDTNGDLFYVLSDGTTNTLYELSASGSSTTLNASFPYMPSALAVNPSGSELYMIYTASSASCNSLTYQRVSMVATTAGATPADLPQCFTFGSPTSYSGSYSDPVGLAVDSSGNLYVDDYGGGDVWKISSPVTSSSVPTTFLNLNIQSNEIVIYGGTLYFAAYDFTTSQYVLYSAATSQFTANILAGAASSSSRANIGSSQDGLAVDSSGNVYIGTSTSIQEYSGGNLTTYASLPNGVASLGVDSSNTLFFDGTDASGNPFLASLSTGALNFGSVNVGATSSTNSLSFTVAATSSTTVGGVHIYTMGASGLDFVDGGSSTCTAATYATSTSCVVNVNFEPRYAGLRMGAVTMVNGSGVVLVSVPLYGTGVGPQVAFSPGTITTVAGNGTSGYSGDNGSATSAELSQPYGTALDGAGNLYIADLNNNRIRKVAAGVITTVAGNGTQGYNGDGVAATSAELYQPVDVTVDGAGNLYIADYYNNRIRKVDASTGIISTVAGNGTQGYSGDGGAATSAELNLPTGVVLDGSGNLYIADYNNNRIREVNAVTGKITTVAGDGTQGYSGDGGSATSAELYYPSGVAVDTQGNLYIADGFNNRVRKVTASTGIITTVAGNGTQGYNGDGQAATSAELDEPRSVALDGAGNLYIADQGNERIRKVDAGTGLISTVAGNGTQSYGGDGAGATSAELNQPYGVATDSAGNIYIADINNNRVREVNVGAVSMNFATTSVGVTSSDSPQSLTVSNIGNAILAFPIPSAGSNPAISSGFTLENSTSCPEVTASGSSEGSLTEGTSCTYAVSFIPVASGSDSGSLVLTDDDLNASSPAYATQTISLSGTATAAATSTAVSSSVNPSTVNEAVTFTATVSTTSIGSTAVPTGTVQFVVDGTNLGSPVALNGSGEATSQAVSSLSVTGSPHTVTANFVDPTGNFSSSSGTLSGGQTVNPATATLAFTSVPSSPVGINTNAAFKVTLTATQTTPTPPAGIVTLTEGGATLCTSVLLPVAPYTASCTTSALAGPSPALVTASYTDSAGNFVAVPITTAITLTPATTTLTLTSSGAATVDTAATLQATVAASSLVPNRPTGTVSFTLNSAPIPGCSGTSAVPLSGSTSQATCITAYLLAPSSSIGATYSGDSNFTGSTAPSLGVPVNKATPLYTLTATPQSPYTSIMVDVPVVFAIAFTSPATTAPTQPTGAILVSQGGTTLCTIALPATSCTYVSGFANAGSYTVQTSYGGDTEFLAVTNVDITQLTVAAIPTATTVSSSLNPTTYGSSATFTATVSNTLGGSSVAPTGTVQFAVDGVNAGGAVALITAGVSSTATMTISTLTAGSHTITAGYVSSNGNFSVSSGSLSQTVNKATPSLNWPNPTSIVYGTALSATQLDATSSVPGSFNYSPALGTVLGAGQHTLTANFTPTDTTDYTTPAPITAIITVTQATPTLSWPAPASITYGTALSATQLDATSSAAGSFNYSPALGTVLGAGQHALTASFTPTDTTDYTTPAPVTTTITVTQATPTLTWPAPASITYGTALSTAQLNATSSVPGSFSYTPSLGTVLAVGTHTLTAGFTPTDATDYATPAPITVNLAITQAALTVTANNATRIYGTANPAFSGAVAGAVNGDSFTEAFATSAGINSNVGTYTIVPSVTGADLADYSVSVQDGALTITQAGSTTSLSVSSGSITPGQTATLSAQVVSNTSGLPTGTVSFYDDGSLLGAATLSAGSATYSAASLAPGITHTITAVYSGDINFLSSNATSSSSIVVAPLDFTLTLSGPSSVTVVPGSAFSYQVVVSPLYGAYAGPVSFSVSGLPPGATYSFSPATVAANGGKQTVTLTVQTAASTTAVQPGPSIGQKLAPLSLALLLLPLARKQRRRFTRLLVLLLLLGSAAATATLTGCGGGGNGFFAHAVQSYDVTITATAGNLQHSGTLTVEVQ